MSQTMAQPEVSIVAYEKMSAAEHKKMSADRGMSPAYDDEEKESSRGGGTVVVYKVEVEWGGGPSWHVLKRYSEFEDFHSELVAVYGKKQVPKLPKKHMLRAANVVGVRMNPFREGFLRSRMLELEQFLRAVVGQCSLWFVINDTVLSPEKLAVPTLLGLNPVLFHFLDFARYAVIPTPQAGAVEGARFVVHQVDKTSSSAAKPARAIMSSDDLSRILALSKGVDLADDDQHIEVVRNAIAELEAADKTHYMNTVQAKDIIQQAFFQDVRVELVNTLLPYIIDPENYRRILQAIDFDKDIQRVTRLFQDTRKTRQHTTHVTVSS